MNSYWYYQFCEDDVNGLVKCYDTTEAYEGYRLLWERLSQYKSRNFEDLESAGIYLLFEKHARENKPRMYVGQGDLRKNNKGMLNRVKEHFRKGDKAWCDEVIFLPVPDYFGSTELNWLEHRVCVDAELAQKYFVVNGPKPHDAILRKEIQGAAEAFVEHAEFLTAALGFTPFQTSSQKRECARGKPQGKSKPKDDVAFLVKFSDGDVIGEATSADTYAKAIKKIGAEKVVKLRLMRDKMPLLGKSRDEMPYPNSVRDVGKGWFVNTHASKASIAPAINQVDSAA